MLDISLTRRRREGLLVALAAERAEGYVVGAARRGRERGMHDRESVRPWRWPGLCPYDGRKGVRRRASDEARWVCAAASNGAAGGCGRRRRCVLRGRPFSVRRRSPAKRMRAVPRRLERQSRPDYRERGGCGGGGVQGVHGAGECTGGAGRGYEAGARDCAVGGGEVRAVREGAHREGTEDGVFAGGDRRGGVDGGGVRGGADYDVLQRAEASQGGSGRSGRREVTGVWWRSWSSKPVWGLRRSRVGSIPIRLRQNTGRRLEAGDRRKQ